jgi:hypothetical protein
MVSGPGKRIGGGNDLVEERARGFDLEVMRGASSENSLPRDGEAFGSRPDLQTQCLGDWITYVEIALRPKP